MIGSATRASFLALMAAIASAPAVGAESLNRSKRTALVLSGGAARGAYEAGVVGGLLHAGYRFDVVCGASIGAVNGAFVAQGQAADLLDVWRSLPSQRLLVPKRAMEDVLAGVRAFQDPEQGVLGRPFDLVNGIRKGVRHGLLREIAVYEQAPIRSIVTEHLHISALQMPLMVSVTNVRSQRSEAIHCRPAAAAARLDITNIRGGFPVQEVDARATPSAEEYRDAVLASAALPGAFDPVEFRGASFADGGVANNAPATLARKFGVDTIVAVLLDEEAGETAMPRNFIELAFSLYTANQRRTILSDFLVASTLGIAGQTPPDIYVVRPSRPLSIGPLDFDRADRIEAAIAQGIADGAAGPTKLPPFAVEG